MDRVAVWARLGSKPGKEDEGEVFLKSARTLAEKEPAFVAAGHCG